MSVTDYDDYDTAAEHARQHLNARQAVTTELAALVHSGQAGGTPGGVPLTIGNDQLVFQTAAAVAGGGTISFGPFAIDQPGYDVYVSIYPATGGVSGTITWEMLWSDNASGVGVKHEKHDIWSAATQGGHLISGQGRTKGNLLTLNITGNQSSGILHVDFVVIQNSRPDMRDEWITFSGNGASSGITLPNSSPFKMQLAQSSFSVAAAGNGSRQMPYWTGKAHVHMDTASNTADAVIQIQDPAGNVIYEFLSNAQGVVEADIILPRMQCSYEIFNTGASPRIISVYIIAVDY